MVVAVAVAPGGLRSRACSGGAPTRWSPSRPAQPTTPPSTPRWRTSPEVPPPPPLGALRDAVLTAARSPRGAPDESIRRAHGEGRAPLRPGRRVRVCRPDRLNALVLSELCLLCALHRIGMRLECGYGLLMQVAVGEGERARDRAGGRDEAREEVVQMSLVWNGSCPEGAPAPARLAALAKVPRCPFRDPRCCCRRSLAPPLPSPPGGVARGPSLRPPSPLRVGQFPTQPRQCEHPAAVLIIKLRFLFGGMAYTYSSACI
jgi:hypothetical protein